MAHAAVGAEVDVPAYVASTTPPEYRTQCGFSPMGGAVATLRLRGECANLGAGYGKSRASGNLG